MALDWKKHFGRQAQSDYEVYKLLLKAPNVPRCHSLHYLQMATEKLAKYFLAQPNKPPKASHAQFVSFIQCAQNFTALRRALYYESLDAFIEYLDTMAPAAQRIASLAPSSDMRCVNAEYPWERQTVQSSHIIAPCDYKFEEFDTKKDRDFLNLTIFIDSCFRFIKEEMRV
jgi:hypothetical protein